MARPLRLEFAGALYHVTSRGDRREAIYECDGDRQAIGRYKIFVAEGRRQPSPWDALRNQVYLGSEAFVEQTQRLLDGDKVLNEVPSTQRRPVARALAYYQATNPDRNTAIVRAYAAGGYTLKAIGEHFGLHYSTVSGIVKRHKSKT
jgi:putative transposase